MADVCQVSTSCEPILKGTIKISCIWKASAGYRLFRDGEELPRSALWTLAELQTKETMGHWVCILTCVLRCHFETDPGFNKGSLSLGLDVTLILFPILQIVV